ncbi:MAG: Phosphate transport system permease protein PstC [Myxococcaceae bacterium]|nr:Phosphate transport system permease protein PstC [Myxococcaceae bacterium]
MKMRILADSSPRLAPRPTPKRRWQLREKLIEGAITAVAFSGVLAIGLILIFVAKEAVPLFVDPEALKEVSLSKLFLPQVLKPGKPATFVWQPVSDIPKVSLIPLFIGTLKVSVVAMLIAAPLGVLAALFTSELAPRKLREWLKPTIELLAGVPSVVLGFFALMVLATLFQDTFGLTYRLNALVAGVALSLAIVPVVFTVAEDALTAVPRSYREASLALGATRWDTAWRVVLPAAAPGVLAACVLGLGRAIGETMVVLMASGNASIVSPHLTDSTRTLSATIAAEMGEVVVGSPHYGLLFFIGVQLFAITFVLNLLAGAWTRRVVRRLGGKV